MIWGWFSSYGVGYMKEENYIKVIDKAVLP